MGAFLDRLKEWWQNADKTQRLVTVFGVAFLLALVTLTGMFASKPKMMPVVTGVSDQDRAAVYDELLKGGYKVEVSPQMEVMVPSSDVARARMLLASKNKMPSKGGTSLGMIESIGVTDSQRKENEKIRAALSQELADSIATMSGVSSAQVHLTPGKDSPFGDQTVSPAAAVKVTESEAGGLTQESGRAIARLVQASITGLKPKDITVVTTDGRFVYDGETTDDSTSIADKRLATEAQMAKVRKNELQNEFDRVFGAGNTIVQVDLSANMDQTSLRSTTTTPTEPISEQKSTEKMNADGTQTVRPGGTQENIPGQAGSVDATEGKKSDYNSTQESKTYGQSTEEKATQMASGDLLSLNVHVTANTLSIKDLKPIEDRLKEYIKPWEGNAKFNASVTGFEFSTDAAEAQKKAAAAAAGAQQMQQMVSLMPIGALLVVAFFLMKSLGKALKPLPMHTLALPDGQTISIPANLDPELMALLKGSSDGTLALPDSDDEYEEVEEETGELDETGEPVKVKKRKKKKDIYSDEDDEDDDVSIDSLKTKVDVPLEQIRKMARKNPEVVATLLKSWMMEEVGR